VASTTPGIPSAFNVQAANQQILVSWGQSPGASSYIVSRSQDNVTYNTLATIISSPLIPLATSYVDTTATLGVQYWYKVAASSTNGYITFSGLPNPGDMATIDGVTFTAVATGAVGTQFNIGLDITTTIKNFSTIVNSIIPGAVATTPSPTQLILISFSSQGTQLSSSLANTTVTPFTAGGTSPFTSPQTAIAAPTAEMTLSQIRLQSQQRADRVNSQFLTLPEWNANINKAMFELYDLLVTVYEDYFLAPPIQFTANGNQFQYPLPNGVLSFTNPITNITSVAPPFYKLRGVDLAVQNTNNGYVSIDKFNFSDRNYFVYPNTASTIYGVFNMRYRVLGQNIEFIPTPSGNQSIRLWYIPRLQELLLDTDTTQMGISGWIEYVIVRAAKYALDKEESDTSNLTQELLFLKTRIEESAANRDVGLPDTISDMRSNRGWGGWGGRGSMGGF
jgi:hypothetical protein